MGARIVPEETAQRQRKAQVQGQSRGRAVIQAHVRPPLPVYFPVAYQWCWAHGEHSDYWVSECSLRQEQELALIDGSACPDGKNTGLGIHLGRPEFKS